MTQLTTDEAAAHGVDPERVWVRVACPHGHDGVAEDHPYGQSVAECSSCGQKFPYGATQADQPVVKALGDDATAGDRA
jgi:hypothetical protein